VSEEQPLQRIGDYEVLGVLGAGGMGKVYKVRNTITDRIEAMKIVLPDLAGQKEVADRFLREIKLLASLTHPNIAALHTALTVGNQLVMVMEFVEGAPLSARLKEGPIPTAQAVDYIDQVLVALSYAHRQHIIHRDIKPANMMLTPQGLVKLMDFGIARSSEDHGLTATGASLGSLPYMSPEQIMGSSVDARADLYSLGVSFYEMITGRRPFEADSQYSIMAAHLQKSPTPPIEVQPGSPATLNQIILMALAKDPAGRFQSADAFRNALKTVAESLKDASEVAAAPPPVQAVVAPAVLHDSPTVTSVAAGPVVAPIQPPAQPASPAGPTAILQESLTASAGAAGPVPAPPDRTPVQAACPSAAPPGATPAAGGAPGSQSQPGAAAVANPSRSVPMPVTAKQGTYRGLYMTLGALVVIAVLVAAGLYLPRWARARAGGSTAGSSQPSSQPPASGTSSSPASPTADTPSAAPATSVPAAASDSASPAVASPASQPQHSNPPSTPEVASSSAPTTSEAPPRPPKKATHADMRRQQPGFGNAASAEPSSQAAVDSQSSPPQAAGNGSSQSEAANAAEMEDLESQMDKLSARARAVKDSVENFRRQQEKQGLNLRGDISAAEDRMAAYMDKAQAALQNGNAKDARRYMEKAETDVETLEKFLGR